MLYLSNVKLELHEQHIQFYSIDASIEKKSQFPKERFAIFCSLNSKIANSVPFFIFFSLISLCSFVIWMNELRITIFWLNQINFVWMLCYMRPTLLTFLIKNHGLQLSTLKLKADDAKQCIWTNNQQQKWQQKKRKQQ